MSESTELAVVEEIPELDNIEGVDDEALQRVERLFQVMSAQPEGIESDVKWRPEKLKLRHPITNDDLMPPETEVGDIYAPGKLLWSKDEDGRDEPFKFVLCYAWKSRARFRPGENTPDCTSADAVWNDEGTLKCENCPDLPFRNGKPTDCHNTLNMVILPLDLSGVYVARFSKSSYKAGSTIMKMLRTSVNSWDKVFGLTTNEMSNGQNRWNVFQTTPLSETPPEEVKTFAKYVSSAYKDIREDYLESLKQRRENAEEGLEAMESMEEDLDEADDDDGFADTM